MGYSTSYELSIIKGEDSIQDVIESLDEIEYEDFLYALDEDGDSNEPCKWYNHEDDLRNLSKKHPCSVFKLSGRGDSSGDIWSKYFKDGKMQHEQAKIVIEDYNPNLLK